MFSVRVERTFLKNKRSGKNIGVLFIFELLTVPKTLPLNFITDTWTYWTSDENTAWSHAYFAGRLFLLSGHVWNLSYVSSLASPRLAWPLWVLIVGNFLFDQSSFRSIVLKVVVEWSWLKYFLYGHSLDNSTFEFSFLSYFPHHFSIRSSTAYEPRPLISLIVLFSFFLVCCRAQALWPITVLSPDPVLNKCIEQSRGVSNLSYIFICPDFVIGPLSTWRTSQEKGVPTL